MKKMGNTRLDVIRFDTEDVIVTSTITGVPIYGAEKHPGYVASGAELIQAGSGGPSWPSEVTNKLETGTFYAFRVRSDEALSYDTAVAGPSGLVVMNGDAANNVFGHPNSWYAWFDKGGQGWLTSEAPWAAGNTYTPNGN